MSKPTLHIADILRWADAHYDRAGEWPDIKSGELFNWFHLWLVPREVKSLLVIPILALS